VALIGLGLLKAEGDKYRSGDSIWQWYRLPFGQTILAKRKPALSQLSENQLPGIPICPQNDYRAAQGTKARQGTLLLEESRNHMAEIQKQHNHNIKSENWDLHRAATEVIKSNFDPLVVGTLLNRCFDETESIDLMVAFTAIFGMARKTRLEKTREKDRLLENAPPNIASRNTETGIGDTQPSFHRTVGSRVC